MRRWQHRSQNTWWPATKGAPGVRLFQPEREEGQSMLEMTIGMIFLLGIVIILFEMALLFYTYISLLNASREGAAYAAKHPELATVTLPSEDPTWLQYLEVTAEELHAAGLRTGGGELVQGPPIVGSCGAERLCPITVTLHYSLTNPTQGVVLPVLGRMGLFRSVWIQARTDMPIR